MIANMVLKEAVLKKFILVSGYHKGSWGLGLGPDELGAVADLHQSPIGSLELVLAGKSDIAGKVVGERVLDLPSLSLKILELGNSRRGGRQGENFLTDLALLT